MVPVIAPVAITEEGVISPRPSETTGVVFGVATEAEIPLVVLMVREVTVPAPLGVYHCPSPRR